MLRRGCVVQCSSDEGVVLHVMKGLCCTVQHVTKGLCCTVEHVTKGLCVQCSM